VYKTLLFYVLQNIALVSESLPALIYYLPSPYPPVIIQCLTSVLAQAVGYRKQCQDGLSVADGGDKSDHQSMSKRHQQAMDTLSVFASSLADQMHIGTPPRTDAEQQEVTEAFAEIAGKAFCA
jgi:hypothetical protein